MRDAAKAVLRGKFIAVNADIKTEERSHQINNLMLHLEKLEKQSKLNPKLAEGRK